MADIVMADGVVAFMIGYARVDLSNLRSGQRALPQPHLMVVAPMNRRTSC